MKFYILILINILTTNSLFYHSLFYSNKPIFIIASSTQLTITISLSSTMFYYSQNWELLIIVIQILCYINSYILNLLVFKPPHILLSLLLNLLYFRAFSSFYWANQTHKHVTPSKQLQTTLKTSSKKSSIIDKSNPETENIQYCKHCQVFIENRDHHCIYIGRCVEKQNYQYFFSYVFFSYIMSVIGLFRLYLNQDFAWMCWNFDEKIFIYHLGFAIISHLFFIIFTGVVTANSLRSIAQGVYVVDEIKKLKKVKRSRFQIVKMLFTIKGIKRLYADFKSNWGKMVGQNVSLSTIIFYLG